jgi:hypothetical protein
VCKPRPFVARTLSLFGIEPTLLAPTVGDAPPTVDGFHSAMVLGANLHFAVVCLGGAVVDCDRPAIVVGLSLAVG